jgi:P-type Mg2+ transporter
MAFSAPTPLATATLVGCAAALLIPLIPAAGGLGFRTLPPVILGALAAVVAAYLVSLEITKGLYRRLTGRWL